MSSTRCGGPVWFRPPGGGFGGDGLDDFGGYFKKPDDPVVALAPCCEGDLLYADWTTGPPEQLFPTTAAGLATAMGIPGATASHIWTFQEAAGDGTMYDSVGALNLTANPAGSQGQDARGFGNQAGTLTGNRRAFGCTQNSAHGGAAANAGQLDFGANDSFAFLVVFRAGHDNGASKTIFQKRAALGTTPGYQLDIDGSGQVYFRLFGAAGNANSNTQAEHHRGAWHCIICVVNRNTDTMCVRSSMRGYDSDNIAAVTTPTNAGLFYFGGGGPSNAPLMQLAYAAEFEDAAAEAIGDAATAMGTFWTHDDDPNGFFQVTLDVGTASQTVIGADARGAMSCDWPVTSFPYDYNAGFSHATKLGFFKPHVDGQQYITSTDRTDRANWTRVNMNASAGGADPANYEISPRGMLEAMYFEATADNGYAYQVYNSAPGTFYATCFFVKRDDAAVANVPGRLSFYNHSGGSETAGVDFVATSQWQLVIVVAAAAVGQNQSRFQLRIDNSGDRLRVARMSAINNTNYPQGSYSDNAAGVSNYLGQSHRLTMAAEQYFHSDQGEAYLKFIMPGTTVMNASGQFAWVVQDPTPSNKDLNYARLLATEQPNHVFYDGVPVLQGNYNEAIVADLDQEQEWRVQWNSATAISPGVFARMIRNGVVTDGPGAGWVPDGTVLTRLTIGDTQNANRALGGTIACFCVFSTPQAD